METIITNNYYEKFCLYFKHLALFIAPSASLRHQQILDFHRGGMVKWDGIHFYGKQTSFEDNPQQCPPFREVI
jgi:hypothetical protein